VTDIAGDYAAGTAAAWDWISDTQTRAEKADEQAVDDAARSRHRYSEDPMVPGFCRHCACKPTYSMHTG
jgi:hypothetical protein